MAKFYNNSSPGEYNPRSLQPAPELLEVQGLMPMGPEDRERLKNDILKNGIRDAIKVYRDKDYNYLILCGFNRWEIALELGIDPVPIEVLEIKKSARAALAISDNLNRRHLTRDQKRALTEYFLKKNPGESNRKIAKETQVDHKTVGAIRDELESTGEIPQLDATTGADGKKRPARRPPAAPRKPEKKDSEIISPPRGETPVKPPKLTPADIGKIDRFLDGYGEIHRSAKIKGILTPEEQTALDAIADRLYFAAWANRK